MKCLSTNTILNTAFNRFSQPRLFALFLGLLESCRRFPQCRFKRESSVAVFD